LYQSNYRIVEDNMVEYAYWKRIHAKSTRGLCDPNQIRYNREARGQASLDVGVATV
jgi:hypothetical protein